MEKRLCVQCNEEKDVSEFYNQSGKKIWKICKICSRKKARDWKKENKDRNNKITNEWRQINKNHIYEYGREYNEKNKNERRIKQNIRGKERRKTDKKYAIRCRLSTRLLKFWKGHGKNKNTMKLLGCNLEFFLKWLEFQFLSEMLFENRDTWHIDHVIPCSRFNLKDEKEQHKCFHWSNMKPMFSLDNIKKNNKIKKEELLMNEIRRVAFSILMKSKYEFTVMNYDRYLFLRSK